MNRVYAKTNQKLPIKKDQYIQLKEIWSKERPVRKVPTIFTKVHLDSEHVIYDFDFEVIFKKFESFLNQLEKQNQ